MKRKICVITGSRAEYGLLRQTIIGIHKHPNLSLQIIVAGMHLAPLFGLTIKEIEKDGLQVDAKVAMTPKIDDSHAAMAKSIGKGILGMTDALVRLDPEVVLVLGDRVEAIAGAISAAYLNKIVTHIHGGDKSIGGLDKYGRNVVTKLSHIHFAASRQSAKRLRAMNEEAWRIHLVGAPGLDEIYHAKLPSVQEIMRKYRVDLSKPLILFVQHSVTTDMLQEDQQIAMTLEAVIAAGHQTILIYPNADAGGRKMIAVIRQYTHEHPLIKAYPNVPRDDYLAIMKMAQVMVGNSSSGIIEAASFHLPVVNIGNRQEGRERTKNVVDVAYDKNAIVKAINTCLHNERFLKAVKRVKNPYGNGTAAQKIVKVLSEITLDDRLLMKVS